jgi:hypothetical protein
MKPCFRERKRRWPNHREGVFLGAVCGLMVLLLILPRASTSEKRAERAPGSRMGSEEPSLREPSWAWISEGKILGSKRVRFPSGKRV